MNDFSEKLIAWYRKNGRSLPWRETKDPYKIWVSETILQQTRVAQGYAYYLRFISRFPDVGALARAEEDEVMRLWQGLGYYSRPGISMRRQRISLRADAFLYCRRR